MNTMKAKTRARTTLDLSFETINGETATVSFYSPIGWVGRALKELLRVTTLAQLVNAGKFDASKVEIEVPYLTRLDEELKNSKDPDAFQKIVLGEKAWNALEASGADDETMSLAFSTVLVWVQFDKEHALAFWNNGGDLPKAIRMLEARPKDRKSKKRK